MLGAGMTDTNHPVTRRSVLPHRKHERRICVTIGEGDVLSLRLERERREFLVPLSHLYDYAELRAAASSVGFDTSACANPKKRLFR